MPAIVTFDPSGPLRIIEIDTGGDNSLTWQEIYSEWKVWSAIGDNMKYPPAFYEVGGNPTVAPNALGVTLFLLKPWRLRPAERDHRLSIEGNCYLGVLSSTGDVSGVNESPIVPVLGDYSVLVEMKVSNLIDSRGGGGGGDAPTVEEIDTRLSTTHGAGNWEGGGAAPTVEQIVTGVFSESLPGAYLAGTAGKRIGDDLDATISSRAAPGAAMDLVTNALDADALDTTAVTEIQAGLATSTEISALDLLIDDIHGDVDLLGSAIAVVQGDTDDIQTRLPAALIDGRMSSQVGAMATDVIGSAQIAAGAITSTEAPDLAKLDVDVSTRAVAGDAMALTEAERTTLTGAINTALSTAHGNGAWDAVTPADPRIDGIITTLATIGSQVLTIFKVETGRWRLVNNQMIFYDIDDTTPLITFNLKDLLGDPTMIEVYDRQPVR